MKKALSWVCLLCAALVLASCYVPKKQKDLDEVLLKYEQLIRWSQWEGATNLLAPEYLLEHPITRLDMERLRLFQVTQYNLRSAAPYDDGNTFQQVVEIRFFNKNRATEKVVLDTQVWKFDEPSERWLLHSGLPDVSKRY